MASEDYHNIGDVIFDLNVGDLLDHDVCVKELVQLSRGQSVAQLFMFSS